MKNIYIFLFIIFSVLMVKGQTPPPVFQWDSIEFTIDNKLLKHPFLGGFNNPLFSAGDLDNDGIADLLVFEKSENRSPTSKLHTFYAFRNGGTPNQVDYKFDQDLVKNFPNVSEFALLIDYNCDGISDLFTYSIMGAGISVFRGFWDNNRLNFVLEKDQLRYLGGSNIYADGAKLPAFIDVNNDGDLDILVFEQFDATVGYYENMSKEAGYNCDSLIFAKKTNCWGKFCECSFVDNTISLGYLHSSCFWNITGGGQHEDKGADTVSPGVRHIGSTLLALDVDKDGRKEVIVGDASIGELILLFNRNTFGVDSMITQDSMFPHYNKPVDLPVFPAAFYLDVNNDNKKDIIVAPFSRNVCLLNGVVDTVANVTNVWYYKNIGSSTRDSFEYITNKFLVDEMIDIGDNTHPVFFDYNNDSLLDIVVGNCFYYDDTKTLIRGLSLFENIGTATEPEYKLITRDYAGLSAYEMYALHPAFGDLDGDGDMDMLVGNSLGEMAYFENIAGPGNIPSFSLVSLTYKNLSSGSHATPQLVDVNADGLLDILTGETQGRIYYFQNIGTATNPDFQINSGNPGNRWGLVDVRNGEFYGYSVPFLGDFDYDGKPELLVSNHKGNVFFYDKIENAIASGAFTLSDSNYISNNLGMRISVNAADINKDGKWDFVLGNTRGGLGFFSHYVNVGITENEMDELNFGLYPNPAGDFFEIEINNPAALYEVRVWDIPGRQLLNIPKVQGKQRIETANWSNGIYFIQITTSSGSATKKIIVRH